VREQLEHDRVIRLLQAKYKRKSEAAINPGSQQTMPVGVGPSAWYPDVVLYDSEKNRKVIGVVEVETAESVNNLEAMSQWAAFSRLRIPFHLYIPASYVDVARRLCQDLQMTPPEIWTYQSIGDQIRFALVQRGAYGEPKSRPAVPAKPAKPAKPAPKVAAAPPPASAAKPRASRPQGRADAPAATSRKPAVKKAMKKAAIKKAVVKKAAVKKADIKRPGFKAKTVSRPASKPARTTAASSRSRKRR
jgi:pyruvate/2-oxoglutarate dehydrogenase complex dihydrolipoamide acyltransferase (E2) component